MADAFDSGEGLAVEGDNVDLNQLKGLFTEWLDSDVQDGIYRCVSVFLPAASDVSKRARAR